MPTRLDMRSTPTPVRAVSPRTIWSAWPSLTPYPRRNAPSAVPHLVRIGASIDFKSK